MVIQHRGQGQFEIKTKTATLKLGPQTAIDDRVLPGPGEYDIKGVEIEGLDDGIFFLRAEDLFLLYLDRLNRTLTETELDMVNLTDILFIPVGGNETDSDNLTVLNPDQAVKVINEIDPKIVIPMYFASIEPFRKTEGKPLEMLKELKVTKASLPIDERQVVVLS